VKKIHGKVWRLRKRKRVPSARGGEERKKGRLVRDGERDIISMEWSAGRSNERDGGPQLRSSQVLKRVLLGAKEGLRPEKWSWLGGTDGKK